MIFRCKHKFSDLLVLKKETTKPSQYAEFSETTYYFHCVKCGASLKKEFSHLNKSVEEFLSTLSPTADKDTK